MGFSQKDIRGSLVRSSAFPGALRERFLGLLAAPHYLQYIRCEATLAAVLGSGGWVDGIALRCRFRGCNF